MVIAKPAIAPPKCAVCPILSLRLFIQTKCKKDTKSQIHTQASELEIKLEPIAFEEKEE